MRKHNKLLDEILAYANSSDIYETRMYEALLNEQAQLHKSTKHRVFQEKLQNLLGRQLKEENFLKWLTDKVNIRKSMFIELVKNWEKIEYKESRGRGRGRDAITLESKQIIYNTLVEDCIHRMVEMGKILFR